MCCLTILSGCIKKQPVQIDVFYSQTCASCQALEKHFLSKLELLDYKVILHDIDQEDSINLYLQIIDQLENPGTSLRNNLSVPLIVYRDQFAAVGYDPSLDDVLIDLIEAGKNGYLDQSRLPSGVWPFKEE